MWRLLKLLIEVIGWLQIAAAPFIVTCVISFFVYNTSPTHTRFIVAIAIMVLGLITGIAWATVIWKRTGTTKFLSKISATPENEKE